MNKSFPLQPLLQALALAFVLTNVQAQTIDSATPPSSPPAGDQGDSQTKQLGVVTVHGNSPTSLPTTIPTTIEGIDAATLARTVNATDAEDALKYFPSLLVRKRYIGDYNHAVLSTRASGTGNSARSLVFADGIQLSNLLGNGATFAPRWGLVTPEEIARVDVLYGPFSAGYSGNAAGAVVDYQTRMPQSFEAHGRVATAVQPNSMYSQDETYRATQGSLSVGSRDGALAWWLHASRSQSHGQPLVFASKLLSTGTAPTAGLPVVSGAVLDKNRSMQDWYLIGSATEYDTTQDHLKAKLAWDFSPTLRLSYVLADWKNRSEGSSRSYLRDAQGKTVDNRYGGDISQGVVIDGRRYTLAASDFSRSRDALDHRMQALTLKSHTMGFFDYSLAWSQYDYLGDQTRSYAPVSKAQPEAGRLTDQHGTGWKTLSARGVWRPGGAHVLEAGLSREEGTLSTRVDNTDDWRTGAAASFASLFAGKTRSDALYLQDSWELGRDWQAVLGLRAEHWQALDGRTEAAYMGTAGKGACNPATQRCVMGHAERSLHALSPKAALSHQLSEDWMLKASTGRAVRFPTVSELYQGGFDAKTGGVINNNPDLRPEKGWTTELSAEWGEACSQLRITWFREDTHDALYSLLNVATNATTVQNVDYVRTNGLELSFSTAGGWTERLLKGLGLSGSLTYADSRMLASSGYVSVPGDVVGKWQPRVPRWRATLLASWQVRPDLSLSYGMRYSGRQYGTLDNSDPNGFAYQGTSKYFTTDLRLQWRINRQWSLAGGIDNLNNYQYWNFHPYPQRTFHAELKFDL
ncbi:TonB-dependent receptor [Mitsuaria sp. WAJ17]|uniref:TonB-dependent receptor n=1 Tax=Mitsuaria sp. WAJ17 TaxID=2761452 RepID=UPI001602094E|nr:TonB-dependent receptor [Mitsuaria sp. WAJ17]MBB2484627.1 TonB-dependent receptor [Mitsuaria sp. WAJ17]